MVEWKTITWFVITLLLMGFFAGIEMAYYSANRLNIELRKKQGGTAGQLLAKFIDAPASFIGATLIGFNIFLIFFSLQISTVMQPVWNYLGVGVRPGSYSCRDRHCHFCSADLCRIYSPCYFQGKK